MTAAGGGILPLRRRRRLGALPRGADDGKDDGHAEPPAVAVAPAGVDYHRPRLTDATLLLLEASLARRLLGEIPKDGMWVRLGREKAERISAEVVVYQRLRRARLSSEVGRAPLPAMGPGLVVDLRASLALLDPA